MKRLRNSTFVLAACLGGAGGALAGELTIATVNNGHMIEMQILTPEFEAANPGITLNWVVLEEGILRSRVTTDISTPKRRGSRPVRCRVDSGLRRNDEWGPER